MISLVSIIDKKPVSPKYETSKYKTSVTTPSVPQKMPFCKQCFDSKRKNYNTHNFKEPPTFDGEIVCPYFIIFKKEALSKNIKTTSEEKEKEKIISNKILVKKSGIIQNENTDSIIEINFDHQTVNKIPEIKTQSFNPMKKQTFNMQINNFVNGKKCISPIGDGLNARERRHAKRRADREAREQEQQKEREGEEKTVKDTWATFVANRPSRVYTKDWDDEDW